MPRLGVRLENNPALTPQDYQELAVQAESRGYETVWVPEGGGRDSLTQLASIAMKTQRIGLGTGILAIFSRTPTLTAMSASGLEAVSQGRFLLGLGVGHRHSVEGEHGVSFGRPLTRMREMITILRRLLQGEQVSHQGRVFQVDNASLGAATPTTKVPIYIAALGPQMLELAGEMADGVLLNWTAAGFLQEAIKHIQQGADREGRDISEIDIAGYVRVAVVDDPSEARESLKGQVARYASMPFYRDFFRLTGFTEEMAIAQRAMQQGDARAAAQAISQDMLDQVAIVGTAEQCRAELERRRGLGLQQPVVAPFAVGDLMESHRRAIAAFEG
jgi:probable F420-dependent oxidoreductase